jgi:hypothetical protein
VRYVRAVIDEGRGILSGKIIGDAGRFRAESRNTSVKDELVGRGNRKINRGLEITVFQWITASKTRAVSQLCGAGSMGSGQMRSCGGAANISLAHKRDDRLARPKEKFTGPPSSAALLAPNGQ